MECTLAAWFDYRKNLIVPNVHWGMNMHECDLLIVSKAGYVTECEIKVSRADLKKDQLKVHGHRSPCIKYLYFAVPEKLTEAALELAPARAGILAVRHDDPDDWTPRVRRIRDAECQKHARKMSDRDQYKVARLGALRIWNLKRKLTDHTKREQR